MFSQVFQIPLTACSYLFFVPAEAFVGPLGEPTKKKKTNQPSKTKSYKGGEGRVLGLVHINSTVCFAL